MKTSEALRKTLENLWDGEGMDHDYWVTAKERYCCRAAERAGRRVAGGVKPILLDLLAPYEAFETWLLEEHSIHATESPVRLQATRKAWLEHLIEHYEELGD